MLRSINLNSQTFTFRSPKLSDLDEMWRYINQLSQERTFIRYQGEEISLVDEKKYLEDILAKINKGKMVNILVFHQKDKLVGSAQVVQGSLTEKHLGKFGIALLKDYRGFGLGRTLMQLTLTEAKKKLTGLEIVGLSVWKRNKVARNLYRQFGFKKYGTLPKGVKTPDGYDDHIFMYLDISQLD